ncbi:CemA protein [Pannus brasiliensis CCIBt3594]|uniref:CemA protein n=1 Tax=Pannus brasiliensis CCIBt3594 TaxID=1427578 RepID=A0AAW9QVC0_9CHRO
MDWGRVNGWIERRALNALSDAYRRAMTIRAIEEKHFGGQKISPDHAGGKSVYEYFRGTLDRELLQIRLDLSQARLANFFRPGDPVEGNILETLHSIEEVIGKYRSDPEEFLLPLPNSIVETAPPKESDNPPPPPSAPNPSPVPARSPNFFQFRQELTPEYEQTVIQQLRALRQQQRIAIRFLVIVILVPLLVQILAKNVIFSPLLNYLGVDTKVKPTEVRVTEEVGEKFLTQFARLREIQEVKHVLGVETEPPEKAEEHFREQVRDLFKEAGYESQEGWKNFLSDLSGLAAFTLILVVGRRQFAIARTYISRVFLSLNDITKAFIFILFTDIFVGFHSAEGWTVLIESLSRHFGWRESATFIGLFVATVPVILDTIFKLLIFNYLTRKSPTAATILEKMNQ